MSKTEKINMIIKKNHGIITTKELLEESIPSVYLTRMVRKGELERVAQGIYLTKQADYDEYYIFYLRNKRVIYSFSSALYLNNLTDRIPQFLEVTVPSAYNSSHFAKNIIVHKNIKKFYSIGSTIKVTTYGNSVACYDMERTICDLVRFRENIDVEIFSKAFQFYQKNEKRDYRKLKEYSIIFNIEKQINNILDVI